MKPRNVGYGAGLFPFEHEYRGLGTALNVQGVKIS